MYKAQDIAGTTERLFVKIRIRKKLNEVSPNLITILMVLAHYQ